MTRSSRRLGALVLATALAGALLALPAGALTSTPICSPANLRLDRIGRQGFTSHREWDFALRNVGASTCHLKGFPGIDLLDASAKRMHFTVTRHGSGPTPTIVLHAWKRAFFAFVYTVSGPCAHGRTAFGLQVIPPGTHSRLVFYAGAFGVCSPSKPSVTSVSATPGP